MKASFTTFVACLGLLTFVLSACATSRLCPSAMPGQSETGYAVYYSDALHGKKTASGEPYDKKRMTAAHPCLPFDATVRVTNLANRRSVIVRVNDRGPFGDRSRIIDVSRAAAEALDMVRSGKAMVEIEILTKP